MNRWIQMLFTSNNQEWLSLLNRGVQLWSAIWIFDYSLWNFQYFWIFHSKIRWQSDLSPNLQLCLPSISRYFGFNYLVNGFRLNARKIKLESSRKGDSQWNGWAGSPSLRSLKERLLVRFSAHNWRYQKKSLTKTPLHSKSHLLSLQVWRGPWKTLKEGMSKLTIWTTKCALISNRN